MPDLQFKNAANGGYRQTSEALVKVVRRQRELGVSGQAPKLARRVCVGGE
jgi:hypothetical protein